MASRIKKTCTKCKKAKALYAFAGQKDKPDGKREQCKKCLHDWYIRNRESIREKHIRRAFNTTSEIVELCRESQGGLCGICRQDLPLEIDHNHQTGKFRGLLCRSCNTGLGHFKDNPLNFYWALAYLEANN